MMRRKSLSSLALLLACACTHAQTSTSVQNQIPQFSPRPNHQTAAQPMTPATQQAAQPDTQPDTQPPLPGKQDVSQQIAATPQTPLDRTLLEAPRAGDLPFYVLHPGDTVDVTFRYTPEFNDEVVIGPDGRASLKSTGDIRLAGRTLPELRRLIVTGSTDKLVNPDVAVSLKDFDRPNVVVGGEVNTPGRFELRKPTTAMQAILMAGGPKDDAALGRVVLFRKIDADTAETHVLHLSHYKTADMAKNDMVLQPGDMILVSHDNVSRIDRFVKLTNFGLYLNPFGSNGIF